MAMILMQHPGNGFHNAYNQVEVDQLEKQGWKKVSDAEFQALIDAKKPKHVTKAADVVEAPKVKVFEKARPGPKPKRAE